MKHLKSSVTGKVYKAEDELAVKLITSGTYVEISEEEYNNSIPQLTERGLNKRLNKLVKHQQRNNVSTRNKDGKVKYTSRKKRWEHGNNMGKNDIKNPWYNEAFTLLVQQDKCNKKERVLLGLSMSIDPLHIHIAHKKYVKKHIKKGFELLEKRGRSWYNSIVKKYNLEESGISYI